MNTQTRKELKTPLLDQVQSNSINSSEFDNWAKAVKRQMIAALSKKGAIERP
ncbi:hypothetical protein PN499_26755 [Kamptonema animale CS-326]|jgi:hypothetical protein|uniref:hypothetical protein n=1 Tax=Kamptonema animale TaxID=92934 RepID=UPI00232BA901|nr:hypothetical protein [Kamptonema animale]MDB9514807.1 hypothetical protein [Kamptonema animale CS-326]